LFTPVLAHSAVSLPHLKQPIPPDLTNWVMAPWARALALAFCRVGAAPWALVRDGFPNSVVEAGSARR
jgi:hypothetical protein